MRVTIVAEDGIVGVDKVFRSVDLSTLDPNIHAVQWDGTKGHVEHKDRSPELKLTDISAFQSFIDAWTAAAPPPPTLAELKSDKRQEFIVEAVDRIRQQVSEWNSLEIVAYTVSIANLLNLASMTAAQTLARDIYLYTKNVAMPRTGAVTTRVELDDIDPTAADPFGDGTTWPT